MTIHALQADTAFGKPTEFDRLERAWRYAKAQWELAENDPSHEGLDCDECSPFCDAEHDALLKLLLHPTGNPKEVARKLGIIRREQAWDYTAAPEIMRRLQKDMGRIAFGDKD